VPAPRAFLCCLPGVRLLEEVELNVVFSLAHQGSEPRHCTASPGRCRSFAGQRQG
jgi:hypothetical protein